MQLIWKPTRQSWIGGEQPLHLVDVPRRVDRQGFGRLLGLFKYPAMSCSYTHMFSHLFTWHGVGCASFALAPHLLELNVNKISHSSTTSCTITVTGRDDTQEMSRTIGDVVLSCVYCGTTSTESENDYTTCGDVFRTREEQRTR